MAKWGILFLGKKPILVTFASYKIVVISWF